GTIAQGQCARFRPARTPAGRFLAGVGRQRLGGGFLAAESFSATASDATWRQWKRGPPSGPLASLRVGAPQEAASSPSPEAGASEGLSAPAPAAAGWRVLRTLAAKAVRLSALRRRRLGRPPISGPSSAPTNWMTHSSAESPMRL